MSENEPNIAQLTRFYFPLAASGLLMTLQQPIITAGIARSPEPTTALAAYGVALNIAVLLESPVQMLLPAANTLVRDLQSYQMLRRLTLFMGLGLSALLLSIALPPLNTIIVLRWMGAPPSVAEQVVPMLLIMVPWPLVVGWRRFHQGILIRHGSTQVVAYATACRLLVIFAVVLLMVSQGTFPGTLVGGLALISGAIAEAGAVTVRALPAVPRVLQNEPGQKAVTLESLIQFYTPLAVTALLTIIAWPLISTGISRSEAPTLSLAAWSVALSLLWLWTTPIQMLQQVAIALARHPRQVIRFGLAIGFGGSLLLASFSFTPLIHLFLRDVAAAPSEIMTSVISTVRLLTPAPLLVAGQSVLQGLLISQGATRAVRRAVAVGLVVLGLILGVGVIWGHLPGANLAALAILGGLAAEILLLWQARTGLGFSIRRRRTDGARGRILPE